MVELKEEWFSVVFDWEMKKRGERIKEKGGKKKKEEKRKKGEERKGKKRKRKNKTVGLIRARLKGQGRARQGRAQ